jgi:uncharacterized protein (DUF302 family)
MFRTENESMSDEGLITVASAFSVRDTIERLTAFAAAHGLNVFARIDHADGAAKVGMQLRPTELVLFGHPRGGTPLMQDRQTAGIDLPLKALAWEDADGKVWLTCIEATWIAERHSLGTASAQAVAAITVGVAAAMKTATS